VTAKPARPALRFPLALDRLDAAATSGGNRSASPGPTRDAGLRHRPSGLGLDSQAVRVRMVERIRAAASVHDAVCEAMRAVPRHLFIDSALAATAYEDTSLPIGLGQTISKPSVVARMLSLLWAGEGAQQRGHLGRVLEIGTGCGYQTALLARMSRRVLSVERLKPLHDKARDNLAEQRGDSVRLVHGDGCFGHPPNAPYDCIIAAAGGELLPPAWLDQLADGGRLIAPLHDAAHAGQALVVVDRRGDHVRRSIHEAVHFVPLKSGLG
jgi:protein-L-isoaspartate(D-aspartate) O-methyltransferase